MTLEKKHLEKRIDEYHQKLEHTVDDQKKQIRDLFLNSIEALVYALEAKEKYTAGHSQRVTQFAINIGNEMALLPEELEDLRWGALLHDVGKIAVDPIVQNKPGRLTEEEYRHMMTHAMVGAGIAKPVANNKTIEIITHHHDHYDGSGLGQTIRGEDIPLGARIVAVADSFDAITSDRPYRSGMVYDAAVSEIRRCAGAQFDPKVVKAFFETPLHISQ
jgi:putative two-component system response regulator